jgi:hypothetical protein
LSGLRHRWKNQHQTTRKTRRNKRRWWLRMELQTANVIMSSIKRCINMT